MPPLEAMKKLAPEFEKRTGIKVEIEMYEASETASKVMLDLNSKRGRYDFILQQHRNVGKFVTNDHVEPIEQFMTSATLRDPDFKPEEQLYQGLWKEISWYDGKAYGFPFTALTMYDWYRSDLLGDPKEKEGFKAKYGYDLGPAQDWKQYRDIAEWFTRPDQGLYGTALQGKRHEALWYEWLNFLYSHGGDMLEVKSGSECGPVIVNSPQAIAATEYYKSLMAVLAARHAQLLLGRRDGADAAGQGRRAHHVERRDLCRRGRRERVDGRGQDGLRPRAAGRRRQGRTGRGLVLPRADGFQEQGSGLSLHPVDDGI